MSYKCIVMGASAGGLQAVQSILTTLKKDFSIPLVIVQHLHPDSDDYIARRLDICCPLEAKEAESRESIIPGKIYTAPANYHILIEANETFALSTDPLVHYCRPSIDVLFESAADVFTNELVGIILTGANNDGAEGMSKIKNKGGLTIVQDPDEAKVDTMPLSVMKRINVDYIYSLDQISHFLHKLSNEPN